MNLSFFVFILQVPFWFLLGSTLGPHPLGLTLQLSCIASATFVSALVASWFQKIVRFQVPTPAPRRPSYEAPVLATLFTTIVFFRTSHSIYDILNPTDLIGMSRRLALGFSPVSFSALPSFFANYHNTFIFFSGFIHRFLIDSVLVSILVTFLVGIFFIFWLYADHAQEQGLSRWSLFLCLLIFSFSSSWIRLDQLFHFGTLGFYDYLMPVDTLLSNSWVFGVLLMLLFLRVWTWSFKNNLWKYTITLFLLLLLVSTNPGIFTMALISSALSFGWITLLEPKTNWSWKIHRGLLMAAGAGLVYFSTRYIPSAFLKGDIYRFVHLRLRTTPEDFSEIQEYVRLVGFLPWIVGFFGFANRSVKVSVHIWFFFIVTVFFPIFFSIEGVNRWDAIHKNAFISILASGFIIPFYLRHVRIRWVAAGILFFSFLQAPQYYDYFYCRSWNSKFFWQDWLAQEKTITTSELNAGVLVIYPVSALSTEALLSNSLMGHFTRNTFYPGFLVNIPLEDWPSEEHWKSAKNFFRYIRREHFPTWIQARTNEEQDFKNRFELFKKEQAYDFEIEFSRRILLGEYSYFPVYWKKEAPEFLDTLPPSTE